MKFYQFAVSHACAKVRIVLLEKGLAFESPELSLADLKSEAFLKLNPVGKVPCIIDGDLTLSESEVIAEYLEEKYPQKPVLPKTANDRAKSRLISRMHDLYVSPVLGSVYVPLLAGDIAKKQLDDAAGKSRIQELQTQLAKIEKFVNPSPYLSGAEFTIADASFALTIWYTKHCSAQYGVTFDGQHFPKLTKWYEMISMRASVQATIRSCEEALGLSARKS